MKLSRKRKLSKSSIAGFTLIEMLVVILMIAVLFAIASPSWIAFLNNQRVGAAQSKVAEIVRSAQSEAKRTKLSREVCFDTVNSRVAVIRYSSPTEPNPTDCTKVSNWQSIGEAKSKLKLVAAPANGRVIFDTYGNAAASTVGYRITVQVASSPNPRRCLTIRTLLGAMSEGSGSQCPI